MDYKGLFRRAPAHDAGAPVPGQLLGGKWIHADVGITRFSVKRTYFMSTLLLGSVLAIVGSIVDRIRLTVRQTRLRGIICRIASAVSSVRLPANLDGQGPESNAAPFGGPDEGSC